MSRRAIIIGAGPAGLTAAYELLERTDIVPVVLEADAQVGGLSKTVVYQGNRMDIGGHRFFSKSDRVMDWWLKVLPMERVSGGEVALGYHQRSTAAAVSAEGPDPEREDRVMLVRTRRSRIYFAGKFFEYPISLSPETLLKLGPVRAARIGASYLWRLLFPVHPVENLEDFMINRFGDELYRTFFKSYTEKVWGVPCHEISAAWGAQRIKDVSIGRAIAHWWRQRRRAPGGVAQKDTPTSLVERFLYPKLGPGHMWEEVARQVTERGGELRLHSRVTGVHCAGNRIAGVVVRDETTGAEETLKADYVFSSMPVVDLIDALGDAAPGRVQAVAHGLQYRDFITVGLLARKLRHGGDKHGADQTPDNWLYIQEPEVRLGRLQFYNNWSPYMVQDRSQIWLGLEYFCNKGEAFWEQSDEAILALACDELARIGIIDAGDRIGGTVLRIEKAYPAYFGAYPQFPVIREYVDGIENLFLIGRNGMHKYNNQDHSMLTAMTAVDNILTGVKGKENLWAVNSEEEYLEEMGAPGGKPTEE